MKIQHKQFKIAKIESTKNHQKSHQNSAKGILFIFCKIIFSEDFF